MGTQKDQAIPRPKKPAPLPGIPQSVHRTPTNNPGTGCGSRRDSDDGIGIGTAIAIGLMLSD